MKNNFFKKYDLYLLSFVLPAASMLFLFIARHIYPFGDESFLHIDLYHQYYPYLVEFYHKLKSGDSLLYSWNAGIGSNFLAIYVYYLASPFNWLALLCSENHLIEFISYMVIVRIGLCGLSFSYYLHKHFGKKDYFILLFSMGYALSGYMAAYNWNVMWLDCLILTPLIILGLEKLVYEKKPVLYCICLALCLLTNYYISIFICIYLVLYFIVLLINADGKPRTVARFLLYSILAGGMAMVLLIPELEVILYTEFADTSFPQNPSFYFSIIDVLARHLANIAVETGLDHWPNIYCGVICFILAPLYFINKNISYKERIAKFCLLVFMILSFSINVLTFIWHGFNYPDSLPSRQSFLYIFLLLTICYEALLHIETYSKKELKQLVIGLLVFFIFIQKECSDDAISFSSYALTALLIGLYVLILHGMRTIKSKECTTPSAKYNLQIAMTYLAISGVCISLFEFTLNTALTSVPTVSRTDYLADTVTYAELNSQIHEMDSDFYRIDKNKRLTNNDAMISQYPSLSLFTSTSNQSVNHFYQKYGMRSSKVFYCNEGATPLMRALLTEKYAFTKNDRYSPMRILAMEKDNIFLYQNTVCLPVGYMIPENTFVEEIDTNNPIFLQNALAKSLGAYNDLFIPIECEGNAQNTYINVTEPGCYYAFSTNKNVKEINYYNENEKTVFNRLTNPYILDLGYIDTPCMLTLNANDYSGSDSNLYLCAYRLNEGELYNLINQLSTGSMQVLDYDSTHIHGAIDVQTPATLLLSIAYEPGYSVYVDGMPVDIKLWEDTFMAVSLPAGPHDIMICYSSKTLLPGLIISILSLAIFICMITYPNWKKNK